jgi:5,10-methylene-tetrahydrofolate dehydrogenase/methenyl tetrahydrofolate cyclohydrolase
MEAIRREYGDVRLMHPNFIPRLDIIKANNRADSTTYVRQKLRALTEVSSLITLSS